MSTTTAKPATSLTISDLATALQVSRATIWRWTRQGKIPKPVVIGSRPRWPENTIDVLLAGGAAE